MGMKVKREKESPDLLALVPTIFIGRPGNEKRGGARRAGSWEGGNSLFQLMMMNYFGLKFCEDLSRFYGNK